MKKSGKTVKKMYCPGYLTVFLTLCLTCVTAFCLVLIQGVCSNSVQTESLIAADIAMNSVLAEYHKQLYEKYDLFFVDTSYGTAVPSKTLTEDHLKEYLDKNLSCKDLFLNFLYQDLLNMKTKSIQTKNICIAADDGGKVLRRQAVDYMYDKIGVTFLEETAEWLHTVNEYHAGIYEIEEMRTDAMEKLEPFYEDFVKENSGERKLSEEEDWSQDVFQNLMHQRESDILDLCMQVFSDDYDSISKNQADLSQYISMRNQNKGSGMNPNISYQEGLLEQCLFQEYLMEKTGNYLSPSADSVLQYQAEYLIGGMPSDIENLTAVISQLLLIRQAANVSYLLTDETKMEIIKGLSELIAALLEAPGSETIIEAAVILYWGLCESFFDIRTLLAGGTVPLMKTEADWFLDMEAFQDADNYFHFATPMYETGLSYEQYIRILLLFQNIETKTYRFMDIVEMEVRETPGNANFRIDGCAEAFQFEIRISAKSGRNYQIKRWCGYYK